MPDEVHLVGLVWEGVALDLQEECPHHCHHHHRLHHHLVVGLHLLPDWLLQPGEPAVAADVQEQVHACSTITNTSTIMNTSTITNTSTIMNTSILMNTMFFCLQSNIRQQMCRRTATTALS